MRRGTPIAALTSNPTIIGAVTVLVTTLAVFLAYNANSGLPFVDTYRIQAVVPNANTLVPGNEVRVGGIRVGLVETIEPIETDDGDANALLGLKLDTEVEPLPTDSTVVVRARSALGLKYLEINRGEAEEGYVEGATIPVGQARPEPVELDDLLNTFDAPTRRAIQVNLTGFGDALAGRGADVGEAIGSLRSLAPRLERVMRTLSAPETQLGRFFRAAGSAAGEVAPVAGTQAEMFVALDRTFAAFAEVAPSITESIAEQPPTLRAVSEGLPEVRPFLRNTAGFFRDFRPGAAALADSATEIEDALAAGTPALESSPTLNRQLAGTAASLRELSEDDSARQGIRALTDLGEELGPALRFIGPAQSVCNYATLLFRNGASLFSGGNDLGNWQRFILFDLPIGPDSESGPSSAPANGPDLANHLHANPYPNTAAPGQSPRECEAGNEPYLAGQQVIGNVPGDQGTVTEDQSR